MATSGTYRLTRNFNEVAEEAFDILQMGADGETLSGDMTSRAMKSANFMLKTWESQGIHLWTQEEGTLFLVVGQAKYDFASENLANTWYETTLDADEATSQTILSVTSTDNMTATDVIGIVLDTDDIHWSTIASTGSGTVTIDDALPSAAASGSEVYFYTVSSFIPVNRIVDVRRRESSTYEIPINFESRRDYFNQPDRASQGTPIQAYFSRQQPPGFMYVWPTPDTAANQITFTYERPIQIISAVTDNFDLPDYWYEAFIYKLAKRLILKFGCSEGRSAYINAMAEESLNQALEYDTELYPITVDIIQNG
jgi:hypothetical protein